MDWNNKRIVISRTDSIGDVVLTLPVCAWLKMKYPDAQILFMGRSYTEAVVACYEHVDEFVNWDIISNNPSGSIIQALRDLHADAIIHVFPNKDLAAFAKKAGIPVRVGTAHRSFHLLTCTHRINFTRKRSPLHEAQLNHFLLKPFGLKEIPEWEELQQCTRFFHVPDLAWPKKLPRLDKYVILHPGSRGSAVDWPLESFVQLAAILSREGVQVLLTGTEEEGQHFRYAFEQVEGVQDISGLLNLTELILLISKASALVACSTGPLHLAGMLNVHAIGLFSPRRPIHPGRWKALGDKSHALVYDPDCETCKKGKSCNCVSRIDPDQVAQLIRIVL